MGSDHQIGARSGSARKNEAVLPVRGVELARVALVEFAAADHAAGTGETPTLVTKSGKFDPLPPSRIPDVLICTDRDGLLALGHEECDPECPASIVVIHARDPEKSARLITGQQAPSQSALHLASDIEGGVLAIGSVAGLSATEVSAGYRLLVAFESQQFDEPRFVLGLLVEDA
jgi:hypothetical protein